MNWIQVLVDLRSCLSWLLDWGSYPRTKIKHVCIVSYFSQIQGWPWKIQQRVWDSCYEDDFFYIIVQIQESESSSSSESLTSLHTQLGDKMWDNYDIVSINNAHRAHCHTLLHFATLKLYYNKCFKLVLILWYYPNIEIFHVIIQLNTQNMKQMKYPLILLIYVREPSKRSSCILPQRYTINTL